jgi:plasmid stabilization system protein ParE
MLKYSKAIDEETLLLYAGEFRNHIVYNRRIKIKGSHSIFYYIGVAF